MTEAISLKPPVHGGQLRQIARHFGVPETQLLDFSANLDPGGPPACVIEALRAAASQPNILRDYPDLDLLDLRSALAKYAAVEPSNVLIANGMAPLLDAALRALRIRKCLLPVPAFAEYAKTLACCGVDTHPFALSSDRNFLLEPDAVFSQIIGQQCDAVLLANPQNPSGVLLTAKEIRSFVHRAQEHGIHVFLDEAFIDYIPDESVTEYAPSSPKLVVFRSVTKFFALAGLRVAYAVAAEETCSTIQPFIASWPVSTLAAIAIASALQDAEYRKRAILENESERNRLGKSLEALGITVYPGKANFLLLRLPENMKNTDVWQELILRHGIVVRNCENFQGLDARFLRVAVRVPEDNARLIAAFAAVMKAPASSPVR